MKTSKIATKPNAKAQPPLAPVSCSAAGHRIERNLMSAYGEMTQLDAVCKTCGREWIETYHLVRTQIYKSEPPNAELSQPQPKI